MNDDHATATLFCALSNPTTLQLFIDSLAAGPVENKIGLRPGTTDLATASALARLVDAGLMSRTREGGPEVYRVNGPCRSRAALGDSTSGAQRSSRGPLGVHLVVRSR